MRGRPGHVDGRQCRLRLCLDAIASKLLPDELAAGVLLVARRSSSGMRAGGIVLLHDADYYSARGSWVRTAAALPLILTELESGGLKTAALRR